MDTPILAASPAAIVEVLFNHLALPPNLPQRQDANLAQIEASLVDYLLIASRVLRDLPNHDCYGTWESIRQCLTACKTLNVHGRIDRTILLRELRYLKLGDFLILHIASQNAGLLIYRSSKFVDPGLLTRT